jgi:hypothetical protein
MSFLKDLLVDRVEASIYTPGARRLIAIFSCFGHQAVGIRGWLYVTWCPRDLKFPFIFLLIWLKNQELPLFGVLYTILFFRAICGQLKRQRKAENESVFHTVHWFLTCTILHVKFKCNFVTSVMSFNLGSSLYLLYGAVIWSFCLMVPRVCWGTMLRKAISVVERVALPSHVAEAINTALFPSNTLSQQCARTNGMTRNTTVISGQRMMPTWPGEHSQQASSAW